MNKIETIFKENYKELYIISYYYLKNIDDAEDVVQGVFVKIIEQEKEIRNVKSYLKTAVRNASLKRIQKKRKTLSIENTALFYKETDTQEEEDLALNRKIKLYKQIDLLPEQCKKVFLSCVLDELKYQEAADNLNISINTVKTQMKKAFKMLRESLKDIYFFFFSMQS